MRVESASPSISSRCYVRESATSLVFTHRNGSTIASSVIEHFICEKYRPSGVMPICHYLEGCRAFYKEPLLVGNACDVRWYLCGVIQLILIALGILFSCLQLTPSQWETRQFSVTRPSSVMSFGRRHLASSIGGAIQQSLGEPQSYP